MPEAKSERINVRLSPDAHEMLRAAASLQQQDLTSFVLGAAMERARAVLAEDRILRLTPHEVNQLEKALDSEPEVVPQLRAFLQRFSDAGSKEAKAVSRLALAARSCPASLEWRPRLVPGKQRRTASGHAIADPSGASAYRDVGTAAAPPLAGRRRRTPRVTAGA
jgi:uncharacterized protein (DUF1778 family)